MRRMIVLCLFLMVSAVLASERDAANIVSREVLVKWRSLPARLDAELLPAQYASRVETVKPALPVCGRTEVGLERISVIRATDSLTAQGLVADLSQDPRVEYAEMRPIRWLDGFSRGGNGGGSTLDGVPNDPFYSQEWWLPTIHAEEAWNITRGDSSVIIAVVDLGVDFSHPELTRERWVNYAELHGQPGVDDDGNGFVDDIYGWDFLRGIGDPTPDPIEPLQSHGTHVAGLAAAARNNGQGIAGVAPECKIMGVRAGQFPSISYGYDGIYYAALMGAKVINCSWGGDGESAFERDVLNYAFSRGCVVCVAAGNENIIAPQHPAAFEGVLSVAATQIDDYRASFTRFGPWVKISAPGVDMISTVIGDGGTHAYDIYAGTSMSTPVVAGVCALVASQFPSLTGREITERVISSADPIDNLNPSFAGDLGLGRVNAWRALTDSVSGIRLDDVSFAEIGGNGDGRIRGGESASLTISLSNDLRNAGSVAAHVVSGDENGSLSASTCVFGDVSVGGPYTNTSPILVSLASGVGRGFILPLNIDFTGDFGRLMGRATTVVYLDSTFVVVNNGRQRLGFGENGSLGYNDYVRNYYIGAGWKVSDHTNALYHGSFFMAADGKVADNFYGDPQENRFDWVVLPDSIAHFVPSSRADIEARTTFDDRGSDTLLFARTTASALAWTAAADNGYIVLEYAVTNPSVNAWNAAYAGLLMDIDLASADGNVSGWDSADNFAYVRQVEPAHPMIGIASVTDPWGAFSVIGNRAQIDPPADWSDGMKWQLLQGGVNNAPPTQPMDLSLMLAAGPFSVAANETRTVAFALLTGQTIDELRSQAVAARNRYLGRKAVPQPVAAQTTSEVHPRLYPNPLPQGADLHLVLPLEQRADVRFYNILGQLVGAIHGAAGNPQGVALDASVLRGASGLVFYRIESPSGHSAGKLLILK